MIRNQPIMSAPVGRPTSRSLRDLLAPCWRRYAAMKRRATFLAMSVLVAGNAMAAEFKYAGFEVTSHEEPKITFQFSAADATSDSPVVISILGRKLTNKDRGHRVSLQKLWLSLHVPERLEIVSRALNECSLKREGEYSFCDLYIFEDPVSKKKSEYYIYVGNWP
jgi:hypothetical protein